MTKLEGNLTPNVRFNAKGDNSLLVFRWGSDAVPRLFCEIRNARLQGLVESLFEQQGV